MFLFLFIILQFQEVNSNELLHDARTNFLKVETVDLAEQKGKLWSDSNDMNLKAYGATMYFMQALYAKNPITKWSRFKKGKKILEGLINENPKNLEMRYLRFLFQNKMPEFLGYHAHKDEDFQFIIQQIDAFDLEMDLKCMILNNISNIEKLTSEQKIEINKKLQKCS